MYDAVNDCHPMAEGWDGDRYLVWRNEDDEIFMAWYTTWDTERDAKEFYHFFLNARGRRAGSGGASSSGDNYKLIRDAEDSSYTEIRGSSVVILEGPMIEDDSRQDFADRLWESELYEASYDICTMSAEEFDDGYIGFTGDQEEEPDGDSGTDDEEDEDNEDSETVSDNDSEDEE
jgi:hypothetical protein